MFFGHSNPLKVIYPLISSEKLGGEALFYPNLTKTIFIKVANHSFKIVLKNFSSKFLKFY